MRKILIITSCLFLLILIGCKAGGDNIMKDIRYEEGIYQNKNWNEIEFPFEQPCVPDKETAITITNSIMSNFQSDGHFPNYVAQSIFFDKEDELWIVSYWQEKENYVGADFTIALRKDNGQVVKMWVNE